jgi:hypothetical protein
MVTDCNCADPYEMLAELLCRYKDQLRSLEQHLSASVAARAADDRGAAGRVRPPPQVKGRAAVCARAD